MMKIGNLEIEVPIIQGGMAIRASMSRLAGAVAREGGIGLIAGSAIGIEELKSEIIKAKEYMGEKAGAIGVNVMVAVSNFEEAVNASIDAGAELIVCGAGFSKGVFKIGKERNVPIFPIVSSVKGAKLSERLGATAIVVEGGNAGGHLGTDLDSWDIVKDIVDAVKIPVFGAGGVIEPEDAKRMLDLGAVGVQMGTRFIATDECEVGDEFKEMYVNTQKGEVVEIASCAGLPANAIISPFVDRLIAGTQERPTRCTQCLKKCTHTFCVNDKLVAGHNGDLESGVFFAGKDVWKIKDIISVKEVFKRFRPVFENR
ncbi:MAG TPA: 2-nitropropane dioxygenase [Fusobacteriaceae bacterium]|nr:2-nitropropane dioxygenase [Fusobacteriaceae bacterium]